MTEAWMEELTKQERLDQVFMAFASNLSDLSHCVRVQVGAVIVHDGRVISTGYNGSPPGYVNCDYHFKEKLAEMAAEFATDYYPQNIDYGYQRAISDPNFREEHGEWSKHEVHGEMNAILFAAKHGQKVEGATIYTTISPCMNCAKAIITCGIKRVVYLTPYDRDTYPLEFLKENGVEVNQLNDERP